MLRFCDTPVLKNSDSSFCSSVPLLHLNLCLFWCSPVELQLHFKLLQSLGEPDMFETTAELNKRPTAPVVASVQSPLCISWYVWLAQLKAANIPPDRVMSLISLLISVQTFWSSCEFCVFHYTFLGLPNMETQRTRARLCPLFYFIVLFPGSRLFLLIYQYFA